MPELSRPADVIAGLVHLLHQRHPPVEILEGGSHVGTGVTA